MVQVVITEGVKNGPPYDGVPCPACPVEVRGLLATVHNFMGEFDRVQKDGGSGERMYRKYAQMKEAHEALSAFAEKHFENPAHSHGRTGF